MPFRRTAVAAIALAVLGPVVPTATAAAAAPPSQPNVKPYRKLDRPEPKDIVREADPHTLLVRFKSGVTTSARNRVLKSRGAHSAGTVAGTGYVKVRTTGAAADALRDLRRDPAVQSATLDYRRWATATPNDLFYTDGDQSYLDTVRLPLAWERTKGSTSQVIAVVDTGVNGQHPDLKGRVLAGYNAITNTGTGVDAASDDNGHGSMVAGIAAANTNNVEGIAGAAWTAKIMPIKVLNSQGSGYDSDVAEGVVWAADRGAKIINLSLGGPDDSPVLHDAVKYATNKGALVVVAAGNDGDATPQYPAAYPEVLAVAATDKAGNLTDFSSWGEWIDIAAPGFDIVSTGPVSTYPDPDPDYYIGAGTSFSAPIVSGVAALVRTVSPALTPAQLMDRLRGTARDAGPRGIDPYYGYGILDAYQAVGGARGTDFPRRAPGTNEPNDVPARATALTSSISGTIGMEGDVDWYRHQSGTQRSVRIQVTPPAYDVNRAQNFDPILAVYDQDLRLIAEVDNAVPGGIEYLDLTLGTGNYHIAVRSYNGAFDSRSYTVTVNSSSAVSRTPGEQAWIWNVTPADSASIGSGTPTVTFQRALDPASVTTATVRLVDARTGATVPAQVTYDAATRTVSLLPQVRLANGPYRIIVGAVRDGNGAVFAAGYSSRYELEQRPNIRPPGSGPALPPRQR